MGQAYREYYWNIHHHWVMYILLAMSMGFFGAGVYKRIQTWKRFKPAGERFSQVYKRLWTMIVEVLTQGRVRRKLLPGVFHSMIFWSFLFLMLTTAVLTLEIDFTKPLLGITFFKGDFYLIMSLFADIAGLLLVTGLSIAIVRRYILKPKSLQSDWQNAYMLALLLFIAVGGFLLEGLRIAVAGDPWAAFSPVGMVVSRAFGGADKASVPLIYQIIWWSHCAATMILIGSLPYTKFAHFLLIPANYMFTNAKPKGSLEREDLEALFSRDDVEEFNFGHSTAKDLTWKNAMDYDACIECGRCEDICPVSQCGYPLNPRLIVKALKNSAGKMLEMEDQAKIGAKASKSESGEETEAQPLEFTPIIGDAIDEHTLWLCRTCRACMEVCPAMVEHIDQIVEVRRSEVMMNGRLPTDAKNALKALETRGNPFGPQSGRLDWIKGEQPDILEEGGETDVLFWIGCVTNYDQSKQHIAENMMAIMRKLNINFALLGDEETCCGDPARCLGDENVYQTLGKAQVEILNNRKFKKIMVICPHCLNSLKNEFQQFGGNYEVVHHTQFLQELIAEGKIHLDLSVDENVVYHDPCYLGRYAGLFDQPRDVMSAIKGITQVDVKNKKLTSFCCGAGGGNYFMDMDLDVKGDERLNVRRVKELASTGAQTIAVSCPYCMQMIEDGVKLLEMDEKMKVKDISTLVVKSMGIKVGEPVHTAKLEEEAEANVEAVE